MRILAARRWLLVAGAVAAAALALSGDSSERPPSEHEVERRLRALAASAEFPLHEVRCFRDRVLQLRFACLVEAPDDLHLALDVRWLPGGRLAVRRPDGTRVRF